MTTEVDTPIEERIVQVLRQLGIERAHFASRGLNDWHGMADRFPGTVASLTLVCPLGFDSMVLTPIAGRLLVLNGDRGGATETINRNMAGLPSASTVTLADCPYADNYTDLAVQRGGDIGPAMLDFMARMDANNTLRRPCLPPFRKARLTAFTIRSKDRARRWCCCLWAQHPPSGDRWRLPSANATVSSP